MRPEDLSKGRRRSREATGRSLLRTLAGSVALAVPAPGGQIQGVTAHPRVAEQPCERILVVDDDPEIVTTMQDVLELSGATVVTATTALEATCALGAGFDPNVVLIDVRLGGGEGGEQLARQLRADDRYSEIPIVLMSADLHELRRLEDSADATLGKPFDVDRLYKILSEMCSEAPAGR